MGKNRFGSYGKCKQCQETFLKGVKHHTSGEYCPEHRGIGMISESYKQGCNVINPKNIGRMPRVTKKEISDYPKVVVNGVTYRDVTEELFEDTKHKKTYLTPEEQARENEYMAKKERVAIRKVKERIEQERERNIAHTTLSDKEFEELKEKICIDLNGKITQVDIVQKYNISKHHLRRIITQLSYEGRIENKISIASEEEVRLVEKDLNAGLSQMKIMERRELSQHKVVAAIDQLVSLGKYKRQRRGNRKSIINDEEKEQIIKLRKRGFNYTKISVEVNRSVSGVGRVVREAEKKGGFMKSHKIVIPGELPGMNEIIKASKAHFMAYSTMKKDNTETITWLASKVPKMDKVFLDITWYCQNRRKDPDNIAGGGVKFIFDGLVEAGVIENDGWKQNKGWSNTFKVDRDNPRVEVNIKEVD